MNIWRLVLREIAYRKLNFLLSVVAVLVAVGVLSMQFELLEAHDRRTNEIVAAKETETGARMENLKTETRVRMKKLRDDYRKITKNLGFNILILPKGQNRNDLFADDFASKYMPEDYVDKLANSGVATINHLLPSLQQKLKWPEEERTIILIGTRGEVPIAKRDPKKPLLDLVPPGTMVVGHELHRGLKLEKGSKVKLMDREFTVAKLHSERGSKDDITIWINLAEAQEMLGKTGRINAILALECNCNSPDRLAEIRAEIADILPETQVIEVRTQALARAEARKRAELEAKENIASSEALAKKEVDEARRHREMMRIEKEATAAWLVPAVLLGCMAWLALLNFVNVHQRSDEIGVLRAIGVNSAQVFTLFMSKASLVGLAGSLLGYLAGTLLAAGMHGSFAGVVDPTMLLIVVVAAPLICCLAGWLPALVAAQQDPAAILREG